MAKPTTLPFSKFVVEIESLDSPGEYSAPCGLTSRGFNQTSNVQESEIPDCDDEDAPASIERSVTSNSGSISGSGVLTKGGWPMWQGWKEAGGSRRCRIHYFHGDSPDDGGAVGYYEGLFVLANLNSTGARGERGQIEVELQSDGEYTWNDAE